MTRLIVTNTPATNKNIEIFKSIFGQISDGIWENARGMDGYWMNTEVTTYGGYVAVRVSKTHYFEQYMGNFRGWKMILNRYYGKTAEQVVEFFKRKIKQIADEEIKNNRMYHMNADLAPTATFKTAGEVTTRYLDRGAGVTFADAYKVYTTLTACGTVDEYIERAI